MAQPPDRRQTLLEVGDVAALLHLTADHVYKLIHRGALTASNVGTGRTPRYRIRPEALESFLAAGEHR